MHRAGTVAGVFAALLMAAPAAQGQATGAIAGRLVDRATDQPVVGAEVFVLGLRESVITDSAGGFLYRGLSPGDYLLQVRRVGYTKAEWLVTVAEGETTELLLPLEPVAYVLPPAVVEGDPEALPTWFRGFEDRRASRRGQYITLQDIERRKASTLADLLRPLNGVRISCDRHGNCGILMTRWTSCRPQYYEDGHPITAIAAERLPVLDIYGVEVYNISEVPMEFQRTDLKCGVIAIWTRRGPPRR